MSYDAFLRRDANGEPSTTAADLGNMTRNVRPIWNRALGFEFRELNGKTAEELIPVLEQAVRHLRDPQNLAEYQALNPPNGWGDHESATRFLEAMLDACCQHPNTHLYLSD